VDKARFLRAETALPIKLTLPALMKMDSGRFVGEQLAFLLVPSSELPRLLGYLALCASFIVGLFLWVGARQWLL
jgi:hypothetical protein